jgi:hypothetical protein
MVVELAASMESSLQQLWADLQEASVEAFTGG